MLGQDEMKVHIIETTMKMIEEGYEVEALTIRKIAQKASIAVGLINYHFGSKEKLMMAVIERIIDRTSTRERLGLDDQDLSPKARLRNFLVGMVWVVQAYKAYSKLMITYELLHQDFSTPNHLVEIIREIKPASSMEEVKWLSLMVVTPLQVAFLKEKDFMAYYQNEDFASPAFIDRHLTLLGL